MSEEMKNPVVVELSLDTDPTTAYNKVANVRTWGQWRRKDPKVKVKQGNDGPLNVGDRFDWYAGVKISSTVTEAVPGKVIAWKGTALGYLHAHHRWRFESIEGGRTRVTTEEVMSGPLKFLMPDSTVRKSNTEWCEELRASFANLDQN